MPGYIVIPNVPYQITASQGETVYFYYTYSYPGAGERNNSANKDTYVIGSCQNIGIEEFDPHQLMVYPNPVRDILRIEWTGGPMDLEIYQTNGLRADKLTLHNSQQGYDMSSLPAGLYLLKMRVDDSIYTSRVIK
jgi:hypothetical protein